MNRARKAATIATRSATEGTTDDDPLDAAGQLPKNEATVTPTKPPLAVPAQRAVLKSAFAVARTAPLVVEQLMENLTLWAKYIRKDARSGLVRPPG